MVRNIHTYLYIYNILNKLILNKYSLMGFSFLSIPCILALCHSIVFVTVIDYTENDSLLWIQLITWNTRKSYIDRTAQDCWVLFVNWLKARKQYNSIWFRYVKWTTMDIWKRQDNQFFFFCFIFRIVDF